MGPNDVHNVKRLEKVISFRDKSDVSELLLNLNSLMVARQMTLFHQGVRMVEKFMN